MMKHRVLLWILLGALMLTGAFPALAAPPKEKTPPLGQRAGAVSALLPVASVARGSGKAATRSELKKGDDLYWNDLLQTARGGRARITLADQSILSLGSQAELRIVKHDARTQQTLLQMTYGRVRAEVSSITRQGGRFEVRTPTAVAGVIGTDFGTESSVGSTTFVCISGQTSISNIDPGVPGSVLCGAGQTTTVATGKAPTTPVPATPAQIQELIQDTEPAQISAMSPAAALPGATLDATVSGSKLSGTNASQVAGAPGVTVSMNQGASDNSISLHITIAANAQPGPRTITLARGSGPASAAVFTVLAPPSAAQNSADPKKPFIDTLDQLHQTGSSSLGTLVASLQQVVDQADQALSQANQNLAQGVNLNQATAGMKAQITALQTAAAGADSQIDQAAAAASASFNAAYSTAYSSLLQRDSSGTPDDTFNQAVNAAFQQASNTLQQAILAAQSSLGSLVQSTGNQIGQISQTWMNTINSTAAEQQSGPTPAVNGSEKSADVGAEVTLDASSSKAGPGASIISYNWSLCDASYKPAQFGVPLVGNPAGCNALPGLMSTSAQFTFPTCNLAPNDYIARLVVADTNQKISAMDVKLHLLGGSYDDPATRLKNAAAAYSSLQVSQFLSFFDAVNFGGYNALSENARATFPQLQSMNINVIVSQDTQTCNTANLRATWDLNYQDKPVCSTVPVVDANGQPTGQTQQLCSTPPLLKASEQLQVRMTRTPGAGWLITDFQGDNGTVQNSIGALPAGPSAATFSAQPDVVVTNLQIANSVLANNDINVAGNTTTTFSATIINTGDADLGTVMPVHFAIRDGSGNEVASSNQNIPTPLAKNNGTAQMTVSLAVPNLAPQTPLTYVVTANPGCALTEKACGADDTGTLPFRVGIPLPDLRILNIGYSPVVPNTTLVAPGAETFTVNLTNAGSLALTSPTTVHLSLKDSGGNEIGVSDQSISVPLNGGASTSVSAAFTIPPSGPGAQFTLTATANPGCTVQEIACAGDPLQSANVKLTIGQANFSITPADFTFAGHVAPFTGASALQFGENASATLVIHNTGNISPAGTLTVSIQCAGPGAGTNCQTPNTTTVSAPPAGGSVTATFNLGTVDLTPGSYTGSASFTTSIAQSTTADDSASLGFDVADFSLSAANGSKTPIAIFLGGSFDLSTLLTEQGTTGFPVAITSSLSAANAVVTAPTVLAPGVAQNINLAAAFTSAPGPATLTVSASNHGVTQTLQQPFDVVAPFVQTAVPALQSGGGSQALTLQVNTAGSLTLGTLPSGITIDSQAACLNGALTAASVTVPGPQAVTWCLQANATSTTGALTAAASMTGAAFSGTYTVPANLTVNGLPDYVVQFITITGHPATMTGAGALQVGESTSVNINIQNQGNASPAGQITVQFGCPNCGTPQAVTVAAPSAGTAGITASIPYSSIAFPVGSTTGTATLTTGIAQSNTANDSSTISFDVMDFTVAFTDGSGSPINLFFGNNTSLTALLTVTGTTGFPAAAFSQSTTGVGSLSFNPPASTLTPGTPMAIPISTPGGVAGAVMYSVGVTNRNVTHAASQAFTITAPFVQIAAPALTQGGASGALTVQSNTTGNLTLGPLPNGIVVDAAAACAAGAQTNLNPVTVAPGQNATWCLLASNGSPTGAFTLSLGITGTSVTYNSTVNLSVGAAPNYTVAPADVDFVGHGTPGGPYTGANAIQVGETFSMNVTIHNTGSASPAGNITVTLSCTPPNGVTTTNCQGNPPPVVVAAPAAGSSVVASFLGLGFNDAAGAGAGYTGQVSITATDTNNQPIPEQSTADNSATDSFDLTDFQVVLSPSNLSPLNILQGGNGSFQVAVTKSGTAVDYAVNTGVSTAMVATIFNPSVMTTSAPASTITVNTSGQTATGAAAMVVSGSNRGVTRSSAPQLINVLSESLQLNGSSSGTSLYLNDGGNPLKLQMGGTPLTITLKLTGDNFAGNATITAPPVSFFTSSPMQGTVTAGGTFDWQVGALAGAPLTVQQLRVNLQLPQTNGTPNSISFVLYVQASGVPDLAVTGFAFSGSSPWLSGQGANFTIDLANYGASPSAGNESILGTLTTGAGSFDLGCSVTSPATGVPSIPANGSTAVTVHCVAPDLHDAIYANTAPIAFKIASDAAGDIDYSNNRAAGTIPFSNWHAVVNGAGVSDGLPLTLSISPASGAPWSATASVGPVFDRGSNGSAFTVANGVLSSGLILLAGATTIAAPGTFNPTVSTSNTGLQSGLYLAQLTLSLSDPLTGATAVRQATIHVQVNNAFLTPLSGRSISFTSSANNTSNASPVQLYGALAQTITVTGNCSGCASGGSYDFSVHDDPLTATNVNYSGGQAANNVAFGAAQTLVVTAAQDGAGALLGTGPTSAYTVNAGAPQFTAKRGISPDQSGTSQALYFNVSDFDLQFTGASGTGCVNVVPNGPATQLTIAVAAVNGFNLPISYDVRDANNTPAGGGAISFTGGNPSGTFTSPYGTGVTFNLSTTTAIDGLQFYYVDTGITGGTGSAHKYFGFYIDSSLSQNFCGALSSARGMTRVRGTWNRSLLGGSVGTQSMVRSKAVTAARGTPDVRISASDISYSPSLPKAGDTVSFRFRISNAGDADAIGVPVALQLNGVTVASDTFDVRAGASTLAGLEWTRADAGARAMPAGMRRNQAIRSLADGGGDAYEPAEHGVARLALALVIDPQHTIAQKSTLAKSAMVPRFGLQPGATTNSPALAPNSQRILLEVNEGACVGVRLATGGTGMCGSADVEITVEDVAKGSYKLAALNGIGDLGLNSSPYTGGGISAARLATVRYASETIGQSGHSYAVQLTGGRTGTLTIASVRSPGQLDAKTRRIFRNRAQRVLRGIGGDTQAPSEAGDVTGTEREAVVYIELVLQSN